jgi:hypothetical protein
MESKRCNSTCTVKSLSEKSSAMGKGGKGSEQDCREDASWHRWAEAQKRWGGSNARAATQ